MSYTINFQNLPTVVLLEIDVVVTAKVDGDPVIVPSAVLLDAIELLPVAVELVVVTPAVVVGEPVVVTPAVVVGESVVVTPVIVV